MLSLTSKTKFFKNFSKTYCIISARKISNISENNVVRSPGPDIEIADVLLEEYLWKNLDKWHNKTAVVCAETGRSYLYSDLHKKSNALTNFLSHKVPDLKPKDTVASILPNVPEYPIVLVGSVQSGLKVTTVNPSYTADEISKQLLDSGAKLIFTLNELWPTVKKSLIKLNSNAPVVLIDHQGNQSTPEGTIKFKEIVEGDHTIAKKVSKNTDDVIILPYSSGTTGLPKGVELTNKNIVANLHQIAAPGFKPYRSTQENDREVVPAVLPIFHIYGMVMVLLNLLSQGAKLVTVPKFSSQLFINILRKHQPTFAYLVPPIVLMLLNHPDIKPEDIMQIRTIMSGAAPLGAEDIERFNKKCKGKTALLQGYGLTETSPLTHIQSASLANGIKIGGSGFLAPNTECRIIALDQENGKNLGPNEQGEIVIRGPQVMKGYYRNPEATRNVLDSERWFKTGDIGHYDEDGHFYVTDRLKELIKVKGFQVAPAELEALLRDHPEIEDAAVVGVPHKEFGEVPKAFVVTKANSTINDKKLQEYVASKVAKFKQLLGGVVFIDNIPKNPSGKILRRHLKNC